jgi:hypothetical protein
MCPEPEHRRIVNIRLRIRPEHAPEVRLEDEAAIDVDVVVNLQDHLVRLHAPGCRPRSARAGDTCLSTTRHEPARHRPARRLPGCSIWAGTLVRCSLTCATRQTHRRSDQRFRAWHSPRRHPARQRIESVGIIVASPALTRHAGRPPHPFRNPGSGASGGIELWRRAFSCGSLYHNAFLKSRSSAMTTETIDKPADSGGGRRSHAEPGTPPIDA